MNTYVALLRAVNVGGTGKLSMADLKRLCAGAGLRNVRTYIQSGNVVFESGREEEALRGVLEQTLRSHMGQGVGVLIRTRAQLRAVLDADPFPGETPARVGVLFLPHPLPMDALARIAAPGGEEVLSLGREIVIRYPDGMGRSKLKLPAEAAAGTMRNLNTVARLVALAEAGTLTSPPMDQPM